MSSTDKRRLLIIRASKVVCGQELDLVKCHAEMLGLEVVQEVVSSAPELDFALRGFGSFEYFYLCSHGNREEFELGSTSMPWLEFATMVCASGCLTEGSTFLMACCRGGLNRVAYDMFIACPDIDYICGPSSEALPTDLTTAFAVFLTQLETKGADQCFAADKASASIDRRFMCFDRNLVEGQSDYSLRRTELRRTWGQDENGNQLVEEPATSLARALSATTSSSSSN